MSTQSLFVEKTKARLNELSAELALYKAQAATASVSARQELDKLFGEAKASEEKLARELKEVEVAAGTAWEKLKVRAEASLADMHGVFDRLKAAVTGAK